MRGWGGWGGVLDVSTSLGCRPDACVDVVVVVVVVVVGGFDVVGGARVAVVAGAAVLTSLMVLLLLELELVDPGYREFDI